MFTGLLWTDPKLVWVILPIPPTINQTNAFSYRDSLADFRIVHQSLCEEFPPISLQSIDDFHSSPLIQNLDRDSKISR
jgi:hypothetical protein